MKLSLYLGSAWLLLSLGAVLGTEPSLEDIKRTLVKAQFKRKLIEHLSQRNVDSILVAASSHKRRRSRNPELPLRGIQQFRVVVEEEQARVSKLLLPGFMLGKSSDFQFHISPSASRITIKSAKLLVYVVNNRRNLRGWQIHVVNSSKTISKFYRNNFNAKIQQFSVTSILTSFLENFSERAESRLLTLKLTSHNTAERAATIKSVFLMMTVKDDPVRSKRSTVPNRSRICTNTSLFCCMKNFSVTPAELSLPNLISPSIIQLNYCQGECNINMDYDSNHAKTLSNIRMSNISSLSQRQLEGMKTCCSPLKYSRIFIKYRDFNLQKNIEIEMNDMIVSSCGCF